MGCEQNSVMHITRSQVASSHLLRNDNKGDISSMKLLRGQTAFFDELTGMTGHSASALNCRTEVVKT